MKSFYLVWCRKMPLTVSLSVQDVVTVSVSDVFIEESLTTAKPSAWHRAEETFCRVIQEVEFTCLSYHVSLTQNLWMTSVGRFELKLLPSCTINIFEVFLLLSPAVNLHGSILGPVFFSFTRMKVFVHLQHRVT